MFQYIILYISSDVILFHRMRKSVGRKMGKTEGEAGTTHQSPKAEKRGSIRTAASPNKKKRQDRTRKTEANRKNGTQTDKGKTVLCRVGSELSLVPASLYPSIRQEEDFVWEIRVNSVIHWDIITRQNIPRLIVF